MSGSAGWGSTRCWSTPPRPRARAAAGGATSSIYYGAADVLVAEVSLHRALSRRAGGRRASSAATAPTASCSAASTLRAKDSADIPRMMAEGVERMDGLFTRGAGRGHARARPEPDHRRAAAAGRGGGAETKADGRRRVVDPAAGPRPATRPTCRSALGADPRRLPGSMRSVARSTAIGGWSLLLVDLSRRAAGAGDGAVGARAGR